MDTYSIFISIFCSFFVSKVNSFIITEYDASTLLKYYRHASDYILEGSEEPFKNVDLASFCRQVRAAEKYKIVNSLQSFGLPRGEIDVRRNVPIQLEIIERDQIRAQLTTLLMDNSNMEVNVYAFNCLNSKGEFYWFITPGFIPYSSFLFSTSENFFAYASSKENDGRRGIQARLEGIIDASSQLSKEIFLHEFEEIIIHSRTDNDLGPRDPLCDLHPLLQFRLCSIVGGNDPEHSITNQMGAFLKPTFSTWPVNEFYQNPDPDTHCEVVDFQDVIQIRHEMLKCFLYLPFMETHHLFYLSLNVRNTSEVYYYSKGTSAIFGIVNVVAVPLLKHLDIYNQIYKNV